MHVCVCVCVCVCVYMYVCTCVCVFLSPTHFCTFCLLPLNVHLSLLWQAVQFLQRRGKADGSFLIHPNTRRPGYYALTLIYNQLPYNFEIVCEVSALAFMLFVDRLPTLLRYSVPLSGRGSSSSATRPVSGWG